MKVLIIGGGAVSESFHIPAAIKLVGVENVYLAEPNQAQSEKLQLKFGLKNIVDDYFKVLKGIDGVVLATPPHLHAKILIDCIQANVPVLCEKPVTLTYQEALRVIDANASKNILIGMCHTYRLFPNRIHVWNQIKDGFFGGNIHIEIIEGAPADWPTVSGYCFRKELVPGGVLLDGGIHSLDFILWCLGEPTNIEYIDDSIGGLESNASMKLTFEGNKTATFRISRTCDLPNKIVVSGSKNTLEFDIFEMTKISNPKNPKEIISIPDVSNRKYDWSTIAEYQLQNFLNTIENKESLFCPLIDGIKTVELIEKCYQIKKLRPLPKKAPIPGVRF